MIESVFHKMQMLCDMVCTAAGHSFFGAVFLQTGIPLNLGMYLGDME